MGFDRAGVARRPASAGAGRKYPRLPATLVRPAGRTVGKPHADTDATGASPDNGALDSAPGQCVNLSTRPDLHVLQQSLHLSRARHHP